MPNRISLLIMAGRGGETPPEQMVARVRRAVVKDTLLKTSQIPQINRVIVATSDPELTRDLDNGHNRPTVDPDPPQGRFHFGQRLLSLVEKYDLERVFYLGAGSGPLLPTEEIARIAADLSHMEAGVIANNLYSTDFAAFAPAAALRAAAPIATDNDLAWRLMADCRLRATSLPRSAATMFDVDTPGDLLILSRHPSAGPQTRLALEGLPLGEGSRRLDAAIKVLADPTAEVLVAGRVGAETWGHLEKETACRVRIVAEERGMRASGRQERGEVRSLLGYYLESVGPTAFCAALAQVSRAAFLDTRVLLAHTGRRPSTADRFYSDLGQPERIEDGWLRSFTAAVVNADIPIITGGHSLVSGGLYALTEIANL